MPYSPEGFPTRLEGKAAISHKYGTLVAEYKSMRIPDRFFHFTHDSNCIWVELRRDLGLGVAQADRGELRDGAEVFRKLRLNS